MRIDIVTERYYGENCYIVSDEKSGKCAVIDPASHGIALEVERLGLKPEFVLLTHGHFDHIGGTDEFLEKYNVPLYVHENDAELLTDGYKNASSLLIGEAVTVSAEPKTLKNGDALSLGSLEIGVVHTPGHTRGCVCYFCGDAVFTGDTVFAYDRGRTDLYGGDETTILDSIRKLMPMLKGKTIYPGHGPERKF
ncbi:MAG: MBL fold metallo-hydrolase [Clostridia bacterium]|nr:MBL fold metallo-hydrolase [Clostridia bacterium]